MQRKALLLNPYFCLGYIQPDNFIQMEKITRFPSRAGRRSRIVVFGQTAWLVSNATSNTNDFETQVKETFVLATKSLEEAGSGIDRLLSVQVYLADMATKDQFDLLWNNWIGDDSNNWPQRVCIEAKLVPGLLVEMQITAAVK